MYRILPALRASLKRLDRPAGREEAVRVLHTDHLMELQQIHMVGPQALQRFVELTRCRFPGAAVHLGHQEDLVTVAVL